CNCKITNCTVNSGIFPGMVQIDFTLLRPSNPECMGLNASFSLNTFPNALTNVDRNTAEVLIAGKKMIGQTECEFFDLPNRAVFQPWHRQYSSWCQSARPENCLRERTRS